MSSLGYTQRVPRRASRKIDEWSRWARDARHATRLSQTAFGSAINRSKGAITDWERGENKPDRESIEKILKKFPMVPRPPMVARHAMSDADRTVPPPTNGAGAYVTQSEEAAVVAREIDRIKDEGVRMRARNAALAAITEALHPSELDAEQEGQTAPSGR